MAFSQKDAVDAARNIWAGPRTQEAMRLNYIANAVTLPLVYDVCREEGYEPPIVCTPYELMGEDYEEI